MYVCSTGGTDIEQAGCCGAGGANACFSGLLGSKGHRRRVWTREEQEYLVEHIGFVSLEQIAQRLTRSVRAVEVKAERLRLSRRRCESYTLEDLVQAFGVPQRTVRRWMAKGLFGKVHDIEGKRVTGSAVRTFLLQHYGEYCLWRMDPVWFRVIGCAVD